MTPFTSNGHAPESTRPDPDDYTDDRPTDAANIVMESLKDSQGDTGHFADECEVTVCGGRFTFALPRAFVTVNPKRYPADMLAKEALEEAGLALLAASRRTEIVWRDMKRS